MHARHSTKYLVDGTANPAWHSHASGPSGRRLTKFRLAHFVAWDGEGMNAGPVDDTTMRDAYVLLANSEGGSLYNRAGLSSLECLEFLTNEGAKFPKAIHVIFGGNYDAQHIIRDLPHDVIAKLHASGHGIAEWCGYRISLIPGKRFSVQKIRLGRPVASITLWDVLGFFQGTFLSAMRDWLPTDSLDLELIQKGKAARGHFDADSKEFLIDYNAAELRALVEIMRRLHAAIKSAGLVLSQWHGAGAIAAALMLKQKVKRALAPLPSKVESAARYAFFGGRIELMRFGNFDGSVYHYDITSAYPFALSLLPNLARGQWRHVRKPNLDDLSAWALVFVRWELIRARAFGPFPFRYAHGRVIFPLRGARWLWRQEIDAALERTELGDAFEIVEAWDFQPDSDARPFDFVPELFDLRREAIARGDSVEHVWKLGLNSLYGKLAQVAGFDEETQRVPVWHNECYAGLITSTCRAMVYRAATLNESAIISINTDGIYSTEPLNLKIANEKMLGSWTREKYDGIVAAQAGVYWLREGAEFHELSRGIGRVALYGATEAEREAERQRGIQERCGRIIEGWRKKQDAVYFDSRRFITALTALHYGGKWWGRWCGWYTERDESGREGKRLDIVPRATKTKRMLAGRGAYPVRASRELVATEPTPNLAPLEYEGEPRPIPWAVGAADSRAWQSTRDEGEASETS